MLLWIDGFEGYSTPGTIDNINTLLARRYSVVGGTHIEVATGRVGGNAAYTPGTASDILTPILTTDPTLIAGGAFKFQSFSNTALIEFYDGATLGMSVKLTAGGELAVYAGAVLLDTTTTLGLSASTWYYIELKVLCDGAAGTYEVRVDGHMVLSDTGLDTKEGADSYYNRVKITLPACTLDDVYIADGTGALNNDLIGPCRSVMYSPDGDYSVNWATIFPANGDHYPKVDDGVIADDDTTYVEDNTTGNRDLFDYTSVTVLTSILGIAINTTCRVTDVNSVDLKVVIESQGTTDVGAATTVSSTDYITLSEISETDPSNGVAWDIDYINAARFGFEVG